MTALTPYLQVVEFFPLPFIIGLILESPGWLFFIASSTAQLPFVSQRLRDMGRSGWFALLLFVPIVNIALLLILFFAPGQRNDPVSPFDSEAVPEKGPMHG
jgi:uncharacterized membrane protein YhaH (DUF805 family)